MEPLILPGLSLVCRFRCKNVVPDPIGDDTSPLPGHYRTTGLQFPANTLTWLLTPLTAHGNVIHRAGGLVTGEISQAIMISGYLQLQHLEMDCVIREEMCNHSIEKEISII